VSDECPTCRVLQDEVRWLREELRALRVPQPPAPPAAPVAGTPGVSLSPGPTEEMLREAGIFVNDQGQAMVLVDGVAQPLVEYRRGMRAIEQALAGKPIETEGV
jgi:hypothetical protein